MHCSSCGHPNREGARYCDRCGSTLAAGAPDGRAAPAIRTPEHLAAKIRAGRAGLEGERKQVTVLFADVMGSMDLAEQTDPEDWRHLMDRFFSILCDGVHRFEGTVDKFTGDGIMALFGAPIAHEDHARRACYAALYLQERLAAFGSELEERGVRFAVRMGVNSGEVVVGVIGEDLEMAYTAVGHTVGLAQRMEQLAEPGGVCVTEHTAALVEGYVALDDVGEREVKGSSRPLRVHALAGVGPARGRMDVERPRGLSRLVGRDDDLVTLEEALARGLAGDGQTIGIAGEAGVGKSRLVDELAGRTRARGIAVYHVAAQAHAASVPLVPVRQFLREYFRIGEHDDDATARARVATRLEPLDPRFGEDLPLVLELLGIPDPDRPAQRMEAEARRRRLLRWMRRLVRASAELEPAVFVIEDLHWLDAASGDFLANHLAAVEGTRALVVVNFRPRYEASWMARRSYRQIDLAPLGERAVGEMIGDLLGPDPSLTGLAAVVARRSGGNPFFVEELVRSLAETGALEGGRGAYRLARAVDEELVPASVQAVLAARIDRLRPREKAVLGAASVIGTEFSEPLLARVLDATPEELTETTQSLLAAEFILERELYPERLYAFRHPLTREVTYGSQLSTARAALHGAVAAAMIKQYPEKLGERAALLAGHWEAAGDLARAARWHGRAGVWSGTSDPAQALLHWRRVRELTSTLPVSPESAGLGLVARIAMLNYCWRLGIADEPVDEIFEEAERLAASTADVGSRALLLVVYAAIKGVNEGDIAEYARLARQALALADESGDAGLYVTVTLGAYALFCNGDFGESVAACDRAIELAAGDPGVGGGVAGGGSVAWCHVLKGYNLVALGELEEARRMIDRGRELAHGQSDLETVGWSHIFSTDLEFFAGATGPALDHAREAVEIADQIGDGFSRAHAMLFLGLAERMRSEWGAAIDALERSLALSRERRAAVEMDGWRLALLAECHAGRGDLARALELADEALRTARAQGHRFTEALAGLALARVLLHSGDAADRLRVGEALARVLEIAHETGARAFVPLAQAELAERARHDGDVDGRRRALEEARRGFVEIGAIARADGLATEPAAQA